MALPSSGPISIGVVQTEFGGSSPASLSEYYAGGSYVPAGTSGINGPIPSSGLISLWHFYQAAAPVEPPPVVTIPNCTTTAIGTMIAGGVFLGCRLYGTSRYAIIGAPRSSMSGIISWKTSNTNTNNTNDSGTGWENTLACIAAGASSHPAAQYARSLNIEGYTDWYLPATDELQMFWSVRASLPIAEKQSQLDRYTWSSTQHSVANAWCQDMFTGGVTNAPKVSIYTSSAQYGQVRAIRRILL